MNILDEIVGAKEIEISERRSAYPIKLLEQSVNFERSTVSLSKRLRSGAVHGIIAEIKRRSPSRGQISGEISVAELSAGYVQAGAAALSILTDHKFFGGGLEDLRVARQACTCPILRKDFILDEYQIVEAKSYGADLILLIARILSPKQISTLAQFAHSLGLEVLLEVHDRVELERSPLEDIDLLGVNNRDLTKFTVDIARSIELAQYIPESACKISESGINRAEDVLTLAQHGFKGFLIGESFMRSADPAEQCRILCQTLISDLQLSGGRNAEA